MLPLPPVSPFVSAGVELGGPRRRRRKPARRGARGPCAGFDSLLRFLSAAEWARVQQTARYLCPGFKVSSPVGAGVDIGILKELLGSTFVDGLQKIEG